MCLACQNQFADPLVNAGPPKLGLFRLVAGKMIQTRMLWQYLPGFGQHAFSCEQCGDCANDEDTKKEKTSLGTVLL